MTRSSGTLALVLSVVSACAGAGTGGVQGPAPALPSVHVVAEGCRMVDERGMTNTEGIGVQPLAEEPLCWGLKEALEAELAGAGFQVVASRDEAHALTAKLGAIESARAITEGGPLVTRQRGLVHVATEVVIEAGGAVVDTFKSEADVPEEAGFGALGNETGKRITNDILASPKISEGGWVPRR